MRKELFSYGIEYPRPWTGRLSYQRRTFCSRAFLFSSSMQSRVDDVPRLTLIFGAGPFPYAGIILPRCMITAQPLLSLRGVFPDRCLLFLATSRICGVNYSFCACSACVRMILPVTNDFHIGGFFRIKL